MHHFDINLSKMYGVQGGVVCFEVFGCGKRRQKRRHGFEPCRR